MTGGRDGFAGRPVDGSSSAAISAISMNSRSKILFATFAGTIAIGLYGPGTDSGMWLGPFPQCTTSGAASDDLVDRAADAKRSRPGWPAGLAENVGIESGRGPE